MNGVSAQIQTQPAVTEPAPPVSRQHEQILAGSATDTGRVALTWQQLAGLLDDLVTHYDRCLESATGTSNAADPALAETLADVLDGFDVAAAAARRNADVLDDLATEITIAQARVSTIWNELQSDRLRRPRVPAAVLERSYTLRAAREAWYPLNGDLMSARDRLQVVHGDS